MKSSIYKRMLRLVSAEVFLQLGFERASEQAINLSSDLLEFYIEALVKRMVPLQACDGGAVVGHLVHGCYRTEEYQKDELMQFLDQQNLIKKQLKERSEGESSLLHVLKVLPQEINFKSTHRNSRNLTIEERSSGPSKVAAEVFVDDCLNAFIGECSGEPSRRAVQEYAFEISRLLVEDTKGAAGDGGTGGAGADEALKGVCVPACREGDILHEQELFLEDLSGSGRFEIFR